MKAENAGDRLKNTGRNDSCPCGSGKKYKKCHLAQDEQVYKEQQSAKQKPDTEKKTKEDRVKPSAHSHADTPAKIKPRKQIVRQNVPRRQAGK